MKRAEVTYRLYGSVAEVVGYKNILTFREIIKAVGRENANRYIRDGAHFYLVNDAKYLKRNGCEHEYIRLGKGINTEANTRTFGVGSTFPIDEMRYIISLMKEAGNKLSGINTFTVKI